MSKSNRKVSPNIFNDNTLDNRNFLAPTGFVMQIAKCPKTTYFCTSANIPAMTLGVANQPTYLKNIPTPGDIIEFEDLVLKFKVDEDLENYLEIYRWMRGIGFPKALAETYDWQGHHQKFDTLYDPSKPTQSNYYSTGSLIVLNSRNQPNFKVIFKDLWPYYLTTLQFETEVDDIQYLEAEVRFKYTINDITDMADFPLGPSKEKPHRVEYREYAGYDISRPGGDLTGSRFLERDANR